MLEILTYMLSMLKISCFAALDKEVFIVLIVSPFGTYVFIQNVYLNFVVE